MIFYFIIEEPLFANLQKKFHTLDKDSYGNDPCPPRDTRF